MPSANRTLTFLFTDLVSSTRLWEEHRDAMSSALARHDALLRDAVERNGGRVVKMTGDGTHAVFERAEDSVHAACDVHRRIAAESWGATGPPQVRIALHTGASEERDGDYFGPTLNRAARLTSIAHGGQSLVSQATAALVRDAPGIDLLDLGEHRLRDLSRPERVYQVIAPDLRADFPPLRSLDALPTNLPVQLSTFIGRADELQRVCELIAEHRVVTLTGVGGVGKTRLALQAAAERVGDFADGVWYCELASATDEESMLGAVAAAFGIPTRTRMTLEESVVEFLRNKDLLWIVDNCEHLLDPAAQLVDRVLRTSERVRVLATSREALEVGGERPMRLRSMATATSDALDEVSASDAVKLFVDRAATADGDFALDASNAATINTVCRRLDGIPLAIVLAAARVVSMSPAEIAARLDERFRLLTGGRRVALERHHTLRAAVEWSYALLDDRERAVFERLAVFSGSFDEAAARAVVTDDAVADWDVIDALDGLVRKSLVVAGEQRAGRTRYEMLETLRQYAAERLDERGESDQWRGRHAEYFGARAQEFNEGMLGPDEFAWRARREPEFDNLRAAISWAIDQADVELVKSLILSSFDDAAMGGSSLGNAATRALSIADRLEPVDRATLCSIAAVEAYGAGDIERSRELIAEGWETVRDIRGAPELALTMWQGFTPDFAPSEQRERAIRVLRDTPDLLEEVGWPAVQRAQVYNVVATHMLQINGDLQLARYLVDRGYDLAVESGNPSSLAAALFSRASLLAVEDPDAALVAFDACIALAQQGAAAATHGGSHYMSALILARRGDNLAALSRLRQAFDLLWARGRNPELDGGFGYAIEILSVVGAISECVVLIGAVLGGALQNLRDMPMPPDRGTPSVRELRDALGRERFDQCVAVGVSMSYDGLVTWLLETLDTLMGAARDS